MAKKTQKAIINAFVELLETRTFDKVTVMDVCEASGVSRSTFYYHYHDINDLMDTLFRADAEKLVSSDMTSDNWYETLVDAARFAADNKTVLLNIYKGLRHDVLERYVFEIANIVIEPLVLSEAKNYANLSEHDVKSVVRVLSSTFVGLTFDWIRNGLAEDGVARLADVRLMLDGFIKTSLSRLSSNAV